MHVARACQKGRQPNTNPQAHWPTSREGDPEVPPETDQPNTRLSPNPGEDLRLTPPAPGPTSAARKHGRPEADFRKRLGGDRSSLTVDYVSCFCLACSWYFMSSPVLLYWAFFVAFFIHPLPFSGQCCFLELAGREECNN